MPVPPKPDTQEGRILEVLRDGRPHTLNDWPKGDDYTGRNAISRLGKKRGYVIDRWFDRGRKVKTYQLRQEQGELGLAVSEGGAA